VLGGRREAERRRAAQAGAGGVMLDQGMGTDGDHADRGRGRRGARFWCCSCVYAVDY
jgi:hypothetical protein